MWTVHVINNGRSRVIQLRTFTLIWEYCGDGDHDDNDDDDDSTWCTVGLIASPIRKYVGIRFLENNYHVFNEEDKMCRKFYRSAVFKIEPFIYDVKYN